MEATPTGWPTTPWELTAPESYVLLNGPSASGAEALKLAALELVARGLLRIVEAEEVGPFGSQRPARVLVRARGARPPTTPVLASVWTLYTGIPPRTFGEGIEGVPIDELAREAQSRYKPLRRFVERVIMSNLIERGLYTYEQYRIFWFFPASRLVLSPAGAAARADLEERLAMARAQFGGWATADPARALAFAGLAGAALLLAPSLYPDLQRLGHQQPASTTDSGFVPAATTINSDDRSPEPDQAPLESEQTMPHLDLTGFDPTGGGFTFDLGALDSLDSAFSAIDLAVDSSGGDAGAADSGSGGDGGGGDGGGGNGGGGNGGGGNGGE